MIKSYKAAAIFAIAVLILAAPVFGESNTSLATAGVFTSDVDDSMSVLDWSGVEFDKGFGFIGYGEGGRPVQLGYATRFGDLYLGTWYTGNVMNSSEYRTETVTTTYDLATQTKTQTETSQYSGHQISSNNEIGVLIGVGVMGFKVGFAENVTEQILPYRTIASIEYPDGRVVHSQGDIVDWSSVSGTLAPSLTWGTSIDLDSVVIKPTVSAGIGIRLDSYVNNYRLNGSGSYTTVDGEVIGDDTINYNGWEGGYISPSFEVGAGIDFEDFSLDFSYGLGFTLYNDNSYDGSGFSGSTTGTVSWYGSASTSSSIATTTTSKQTTLTISEYTALSHSIHLGFYKDKEVAEGLKLGLYAGADVGIGTSTTDPYTLTYSISETKQNNAALSSQNTRTEIESRTFTNSESETTFTIKPFINLGASYSLIPGRFTINTGIALNPLGYESTVTRNSSMNGTGVTRTKSFVGGNETENKVDVNGGTQTVDTVAVDNQLSRLSAGLWGGFVFNFTDSFALDTVFGASGSDFRLDAAAFNVLLSFKF